jgi:hypothetical protein
MHGISPFRDFISWYEKDPFSRPPIQPPAKSPSIDAGKLSGKQALSKARSRFDSFALHALIGLARCEVLVFFGSPVGPLDDHAFDLVAFSQAESDGKFGL